MKKRFLLLFVFISLLSSNLFAITSNQMGIIINLAGKQRMLTQKMSKEALLIKNNIDTKTNISLLKNDYALFDTTLKGLQNGDKELKLVKVNSQTIQSQLKKVEQLWQPFSTKIKNVINKTATNDDYLYITNNNIELLKNMHKAVLLFVDESKKVSKIKSNLAQDINIAGRQRMLTQKLAKDMMQIVSNLNSENAKKDLIETKKLFTDSLNSLLSKKTLPKIKGQLLVVKKLWSKVNPYLKPKYAKKQKVYTITKVLDKTKVEMNKAVNLYQNSAKRQILAKSLSNLVNQLMMRKNLKGLILNLSGRQRMLTQRISKDSLLIATNIDKENAQKDILFASNLYNKTLNGFINGDKSLKLVPTKDSKIKLFLKEVKQNWDAFYKNVQNFAKTRDKNSLKYIIANNENMLKLSNQLVQMYKHSATSSKISKEMAEKIDLSGRQRMLSQKILKEKLLSLFNINKTSNDKKLQKDMYDFDIVLHDLIKGSKQRNWSPEAITHILTQLKLVESIWQKFKPIIEKEKLSRADLASINKLDMKLLFEMNKAVKMYEEALDIYKDKLNPLKNNPLQTKKMLK